MPEGGKKAPRKDAAGASAGLGSGFRRILSSLVDQSSERESA